MCYRKGMVYQLPFTTTMLCNTQAVSGLQSHSLLLVFQHIDCDVLLF